MARPTLYDPKFIEMLIKHFNREPYKKIKKKGRADKIAVCDFPTLAGFAIKIGVHRDTLHEWSTTYPEFGYVYKMAKDYQEHILVTNGMRDLVPANFASFTAINVLHWRKGQPGDAEVIVNNMQNLSDEQLEQLIKDKQEKLKKKG